MEWENLLKNRCPYCNIVIKRKSNSNYICGNCGFFARYGKIKKVIQDLEVRKITKQADDFLKSKGIKV